MAETAAQKAARLEALRQKLYDDDRAAQKATGIKTGDGTAGAQAKPQRSRAGRSGLWNYIADALDGKVDGN